VAAAALRALDAEIAIETDAASDPDQDDRPVEDFAVWLRRIGVDRAAAVAALADAETRSAEARAVLAASRTAERALEILMEQQAAERGAAEQRREQAVLDEIGAARHGSH
jgi:flagellar export protein FliJ